MDGVDHGCDDVGRVVEPLDRAVGGGLWGVVAPAGEPPAEVVFLDDAGTEILRFPSGL
ncbi:MAG TPA: hypothetical protein VIL36_10540 [Acidimicrobiales bacterium]